VRSFPQSGPLTVLIAPPSHGCSSTVSISRDPAINRLCAQSRKVDLRDPGHRSTGYSVLVPIARAVPQRVAYTHPMQTPKANDRAEEYSMMLSLRSSSSVT